MAVSKEVKEWRKALEEYHRGIPVSFTGVIPNKLKPKKTKKKKKCHFQGSCWPNNPFHPKDCKKCNCYY
jgi:hypothetical protein